MPATTSDIMHLLSRTGVRVDPKRVAELANLELVDVVNQVCDFSKNPTFSVRTKAEYTNANGDINGYARANAIINDWFDRLATLPNPLEAKLTLFWHSHFAVSNAKLNNALHMVDYYETLAKLGAGPFEDLCQAISIEPAMLVFLDNRSNRVGVPQENFARELMELFVLGRNRGYTQNDVTEMARAWTGYRLENDFDDRGEYYIFGEGYHDGGDKTIFGITKKWKGPEVITEMCRGSRRQQAAEHLAGKLWAFFAYESPDASLVASLADDFLAVGMNTLEFLKRMFVRSEFYSERAKQGRIKSPVEWGAMVLGATGMSAHNTQVSDSAGWAGQYLFYPPNVNGWKLNSVWMTEGEFWAIDGGIQEVAYQLLSDTTINPPLRSKFANIPNLPIADAVQTVTQAFGLITLSATTRNALERWLEQYRASGFTNGEAFSLIRLVALSIEARLA